MKKNTVLEERYKDTYDAYAANSSLEKTYNHGEKLNDAYHVLKEYNGDEVMRILGLLINDMYDKMIRKTIGEILGKNPDEVTEDEIELSKFKRSVEVIDVETQEKIFGEVHLSDNEFRNAIPELKRRISSGMPAAKAAIEAAYGAMETPLLFDIANNNKEDISVEKLFVAELACGFYGVDKIGSSYSEDDKKAYIRKIYRTTIADMYDINPAIIPNSFIDRVIQGKPRENGTFEKYTDSEVMKYRDELVNKWQQEYDFINSKQETTPSFTR